WRGAHIEYAMARVNAEKPRHRLRSLILDRNVSRAKRLRSRRASAADGKRALEEGPWRNSHAGSFELAENFLAAGFIVQGTTEPRYVIVRLKQRNRARFPQPLDPPLDHPRWMRVQDSKKFGLGDVCRQEFLRRCVRFGGCSAQHRIHQRGRRTLPRELYHLDRFVHRGSRRNFV